ncbi:MAG: hypothetical protein ACFFDN_30975 [Candidatus Hodarchaeota archaeon]
MNRYVKMVIIGIIGLVIVGILLGVTTPPPAKIEIPAASLDLILLLVILELEDESLRDILLILWLLGIIAATSEE